MLSSQKKDFLENKECRKWGGDKGGYFLNENMIKKATPGSRIDFLICFCINKNEGL